jgi:hypothetical protein
MRTPTRVMRTKSRPESEIPMSDTFPATLLHAIDRWQKGGDHAAKMRRGQRLKEEVLALNDTNLRWCPEVVYRRLALPQRFIWTFITTGVLPETISAWSLDPDVAKGIKGGVPPEWKDGRRWMGVILEHKPRPEEVVVNLDALWVDLKYQRSLSESAPEKHADGIRRYGNSQREVVLIPFIASRIVRGDVGSTMMTVVSAITTAASAVAGLAAASFSGVGEGVLASHATGGGAAPPPPPPAGLATAASSAPIAAGGSASPIGVAATAAVASTSISPTPPSGGAMSGVSAAMPSGESSDASSATSTASPAPSSVSTGRSFSRPGQYRGFNIPHAVAWYVGYSLGSAYRGLRGGE